MKIAACFSGRIRNFEDTFPYFKKNFFDIYDVDTFFSTDLQTEMDEIRTY